MARPLFGGLFALLLCGLLTPPWAAAAPVSKRDGARARLAKLEGAVQAEDARLASIQGRLNGLAGEIDVATAAYQETQQSVMDLRDAYQNTEERYLSLRDILDSRAANAYMDGPGTGIDALLGSTSFLDFTDRAQFLNSVAAHDSELANRVEGAAGQIRRREAALSGTLEQQAGALGQLDSAQTQLDDTFRREQSIRNDLGRKKAALRSLVRTLDKKLAAAQRARAMALTGRFSGAAVNIKHNPFHVCPVGLPRAFSDSFGAPRYTTNPPHPHAGNDIMAPTGTPIYAPFDGVATDASGGLGGLAVVVTGADGYTYNAHVEAFGTLGKVKVGTIVGYVGNTGDASGGATHDHFEWHPNVIPAHPYVSAYGYTVINGTAIDPYPYLTQVC